MAAARTPRTTGRRAPVAAALRASAARRGRADRTPARSAPIADRTSARSSGSPASDYAHAGLNHRGTRKTPRPPQVSAVAEVFLRLRVSRGLRLAVTRPRESPAPAGCDASSRVAGSSGDYRCRTHRATSASDARLPYIRIPTRYTREASHIATTHATRLTARLSAMSRVGTETRLSRSGINTG